MLKLQQQIYKYIDETGKKLKTGLLQQASKGYTCKKIN